MGNPIATSLPQYSEQQNRTQDPDHRLRLNRVTGKTAKMMPSRMWVEGRHDWQLIDKVWGEDLRLEGIAVEELAGVDRLQEMLEVFQPGPGRRADVLVDHLLPAPEESRLVNQALARYGTDNILVLGHPCRRLAGD